MSRRRPLIGLPVLILLLAHAQPARAGTITLVVNQNQLIDAFVMSGAFSNTNFGGTPASPAAVGQQNSFTGNQIGRQLYQFDVPLSYTDLGDILTATLYLTVRDNFAGFPTNTAIYGITDAWNESSVTWNTQPATDSSEIDSVLISSPPLPFGRTFEYDVTSYIQSQVLVGESLFSFQQRAQDETIVGGVRWWQREGAGVVLGSIEGKAPLLHIVLDAPGTQGNTFIQVPEQPSTFALLIIGFAALVAHGRLHRLHGESRKAHRRRL